MTNILEKLEADMVHHLRYLKRLMEGDKPLSKYAAAKILENWVLLNKLEVEALFECVPYLILLIKDDDSHISSAATSTLLTIMNKLKDVSWKSVL